MRRLARGIAALAGTIAATQLLPVGHAQAAGVDLGTKGSVVAGVAAAQSGQEVAFQFTVTNHSSSRTEVFITLAVTGAGSASAYVCPTTGSRVDINTDGDTCEPGYLAGGNSTSVAALVQLNGVSGQQVSVRVCASSNSTAADPNPSNDCKALRLPIA